MPDKQAPVISHGKQAVTESLSIPVFGGARVYFGEIRLLAPSGRTALVLAGILSRTISKKRVSRNDTIANLLKSPNEIYASFA